VRATVLSVGAELLRGDIVDTNAAFLSSELTGLGFDVAQQITAGDEMGPLVRAVRGALDDADVLVSTGGLGPTEDDNTRQAIAEALGEEPHVDEGLVAEIEARFRAMGREMPERNRQQALLIPSGEAVANPNGTAPGWLVRRGGTVIAALPGPPAEMQPMWRDSIRPVLSRLLPGSLAMRTLMTWGLGESAVEERIRDVIHHRSEVTLATYAKSAGVQVHISSRAPEQSQAEHLAGEAEDMVMERLGSAVYARRDTTLSHVVIGLLRERAMTVSVMESCTGGLLGSLLTDVPGSSNAFVGGIIAYSRATKERYGVPRDVIERYGVYSDATARAMAETVRNAMGTHVGLGITGIAGSESLEGVVPGTAFVAASIGERTVALEIHRPGSREGAKRFFAQTALDLLRRELVGDPS
jgi:nicotinamide-nucleotide amidase